MQQPGQDDLGQFCLQLTEAYWLVKQQSEEACKLGGLPSDDAFQAVGQKHDACLPHATAIGPNLPNAPQAKVPRKEKVTDSASSLAKQTN